MRLFSISLILFPISVCLQNYTPSDKQITGSGFKTNMSAKVQETAVPFTIEGTLKNFKKKKAIVYVGWAEPWEHHEFLQADIIDGKFKVTGKMSQPTIGSLRIVTFNDSMQKEQQVPWECDNVEFFLCSGKTTVIGTDSVRTAKITSGCKENKLYKDYSKALEPISNESDSIVAAWKNAMTKKDSCMMKILDNAYLLTLDKEHLLYQTYILKNPTSYLSVHLLNRFVYQIKDTIRLNLALTLLNKLSPSLQTSPITAAINERIDQRLYPVVNKPMFPVVLNNTEGVSEDITKYKGKILLIDFWASWCYPCRKEAPQLINLYNKYKEQGFEMIGISIDESKDKWLEAIQKDKLPWPQFIDDTKGLENSYAGRAARLYRVKGVPTKFLVNAEGMIIAKDLTVEQFEGKIKGLLTAKK